MKWEEVNLKARKKVWRVYRQKLFKKEGWLISFEQVDSGWTGCRGKRSNILLAWHDMEFYIIIEI